MHRHASATGIEGGFSVPVAAFKFAHGGPRVDTPPPSSASTTTRFSPNSAGAEKFRRCTSPASRNFPLLPLMQKLSYDPIRDLLPVSMVTNNGMAFAVSNDLPVRSHARVHRLCARQSRQDQLRRDRAWLLQPSRAGGVCLAREARPRGRALHRDAAVDHGARSTTQFRCSSATSADIIESAQGGKVRMLAFSTEKRLTQYPDIPTVAETTPGFVVHQLDAAILRRRARHARSSNGSRKRSSTVSRDPEVIKLLGDLSVECGRQHAGGTRCGHSGRTCRSIASAVRGRRA